MSRRETPGEVSVQALLDSAKAVPPQPQAVRARVLERARTTAASAPPVNVVAPAARPRFPSHWVGKAAAAAVGVGIAGTVYALGGGWPRPEAPVRAASSPAVSSRTAPPAVPVPAPAPVAPRPEPPSKSSVLPAAEPAAPSTPRQGRGQQNYGAELELMRSAHTAYAAHEFANALVLVSEHARRFPRGLLAEEREALRVRCLAGSGRVNEARRVAASFAKRFPRSVLLPRLQGDLGTGAE